MKLTSSQKLNDYLDNMGIFTYDDVLAHLPRRYDSYVYSSSEEKRFLRDKQKVVLLGKVITKPTFQRFGRTTLVKFIFRSVHDSRDYQIEAWNRNYLVKTIELEAEYTLKGSYDAKGHCLNMMALKKGRIPESEQMVPVYSLPEDYPEYAWRTLVKKALKEKEGKMAEVVPPDLREKYRLLPRLEALKRCHFPRDLEDVRQGLRVLKYEEALVFSLKNQWIRMANKVVCDKPRKEIDFHKVGAFVSSLPFPLTGDQKKAVRAGLSDMNSPTLMYRLLQGDVGTGKTLVAAILLYGNYLRGEQGALLAPTDALARQHFESLQKMFASFGVKISLLVGALSPKEKGEVISRLRSGETDIVIGTHALFSNNVQYENLGFVIIDEQHKFGVNQRRLLAEKGKAADLLLMSATPIPRTLANSMYGDLDVSILSEFPSQKRSVVTKIVAPEAKEILRSIASSIGEDRRIYIVAPQIEKGLEGEDTSAEEVFAHYSHLFPSMVSLLHGKMDQEDKDAAIASFKDGSRPILVATSVIEVGIDVPKANLMILYSPTHFGLAALHQLRGRIGRDGSEAKCLLVYGRKVQEDLEKLNVLAESNDGFYIAEEDLKRRGPGEITGVRQSGIPEFRFVNVIEDFKMFECARMDAMNIVKEKDDPKYINLAEKTREEALASALA